jgi:ATP/maltotriose-dependent transcriptional regulator MalT
MSSAGRPWVGSPRHHLVRPRLLSLLQGGLSRRLTLLHAPAGFGKTTVLADFVEQIVQPTFWYHLDQRDAAPLGFCGATLAALQARVARNGRAAGAAVALPRGGGTELAALLASEIEVSAQTGLVVVLDAYESVAGAPTWEQFLAQVVDFCPASIHWFIGTRARPNLPIGRLRMEEQLLEVTAVDLAFTDDEIERFFETLEKPRLREQASRPIHGHTFGWPAGVGMAGRLVPRADLAEQALAESLSSAQTQTALYDYLAEEVFAREDAETQRFLLETSVLPYLTPSVCDRLLEIDESAAVLEGLRERGLFTHRIGEQRYGYYPVFREFLLMRLQRTQSASSVRTQHGRAGRVLEAADDWDAALDQYAQAQELKATAALLERVGWDCLRGGEFERVARWLDLLPQQAIQQYPWLLTLKAGILWRQGEHARALETLEHARWLFEAAGDARGLRWLACEAGFVYFQHSQFASAAETLRSVLEWDEGDPLLRAETLAALSLNCRGMDDVEGVIRYGQAALQEFRRVGRGVVGSTGQARVYRNMAIGYLRNAQPRQAQEAAERAVAMCRSESLTDHELAWALAMHGTVLVMVGRLSEALATLDEAGLRATPHCGPQEDWIAYWRGNALRDLGRFLEADEGYPPTHQRALLERTFLLVRQGRVREALDRARECYGQLEEHPWVSLHTTAKVVLGIALRAGGFLDDGRQHLAEAAAVLRQKGYRHKLASVDLHLATAWFAAGQTEPGRDLLREAFEIAADAGLYQFWWWDPALVLDLSFRAVREDICAAYATELIGSHFTAEHAGRFLELTSSPDPGLRERAWSVLRRLVQSEPVDELVRTCSDPEIRDAILADLAAGVLTPAGLVQLRRQRGLSWKEVQVFATYYLRTGRNDTVAEERVRQHCAGALCLSENTLKTHITRIRRKLGLSGRGGILSTYRWAHQLALTTDGAPSDTSPP